MGRRGYRLEFRRKIQDLVEAGRPIAEVAALLRCAGPGHAEAAISVLDQIANASSSNSSATRQLIRSSTASS
jgi:hypothetical protein